MTLTKYNTEVHSGGKPIRMWTKGVPVEEAALLQLKNTAELPFIHKHVAVMPDVHWGMGATIGSVIATKGAIIPAAVGVDIGCGMMASRTALHANDLPDNLFGVRSAIEAAVPHGRTDPNPSNDKGAWTEAPERVACAWSGLSKQFDRIVESHPRIRQSNNVRHLGTLGSGNHFIEVCLDEKYRVWVMNHSGSRGVGGRIGNHFIGLAKKEMSRFFINLPDQNLSYLPEGTEYFHDYWNAVSWAQRFAARSRELMMEATMDAMRTIIPGNWQHAVHAVNCHHNYVSRERHYGDDVLVTRKGAVKAGEGDLGIIPGSMGARSFIVRGKGNRESFSSCSHGAGRIMSRTKAKATFSLEDHAKATKGIECRKDAEVIDETPGAYMDIDAVMAAQSDLVDIVHTLRQVVCVKG